MRKISSSFWLTGRLVGVLLVFMASVCFGQDPVELTPRGGEADPPGEEEIDPEGVEELGDLMELDDLLALEVETVSIASKQESRLDATAAAVSKLTSDDLIRMGVDSIVDSLRAIPGAVVGRGTRAIYGANIRGAGDVYARHLLVARDGRPLYTQTFSGVQWEREDYVLRDIEAIEVIRGPGGTLWGANAVQGVINIVTKSAFDTLGWQVGMGIGSHERFRGEVRYGSLLSEDTAMRVYGKWFDRDGFPLENSESEYGNHSSGMAGFRIDSRLSARDELTLSGEFLSARSQIRFLSTNANQTAAFIDRGALVESASHLLTNWRRDLGDGSSLDATAYLDWKQLKGEFAGETLLTGEIDVTHAWKIDDRWQVTYGGNARLTHASYDARPPVEFIDDVELIHLLGVFGQVTYSFLPDELWVTMGTKLELHERSGFEYQPSVRATWIPHEEHTLWGALSRAVRTPGAIDQNINGFLGIAPPPLPGFNPSVVNIVGNPDFDSEVSHILELGWRWKPASNLAFDVAGYIQTMRNRRVSVQRDPILQMAFPPYFVVPVQFVNGAQSTTFGVEASAVWRPYENWKLTGWYSWAKADFEEDDFVMGADEQLEGALPRHSVHLRSDLDLTDDLSWNLSAWGRSELGAGDIGTLVRLDTSFRWRPIDGVEMSLGGRNLLEESNVEAESTTSGLTERIEREFWFALDLTF